jgi:hypothetical protein
MRMLRSEVCVGLMDKTPSHRVRNTVDFTRIVAICMVYQRRGGSLFVSSLAVFASRPPHPCFISGCVCFQAAALHVSMFAVLVARSSAHKAGG